MYKSMSLKYEPSSEPLHIPNPKFRTPNARCDWGPYLRSLPENPADIPIAWEEKFCEEELKGTSLYAQVTILWGYEPV